MPGIVLQDITKVYMENGRITPAVKGLSLSIEQGELLVLVGPSGSGKTTLLRVIAGLEEPNAGRVYVKGKPDLPTQDRGLAMVFQNQALYPHMTVFENLAFPLKTRRMDGVHERVEAVSRLMRLSERLIAYPHELSGGEQQRVALARALIWDPEAILLDEPLSHLDPEMKEGLRTEMAKIQRQTQRTMIYVTHDAREAMLIADRIAVMHEGTLVQLGKPGEIYTRPANSFVARFFGEPPINLLRGRLGLQGTTWYFEEFTEGTGEPLRLPLPDVLTKEYKCQPGIEVILGLRPEHLVLEENGPYRAKVERLFGTGIYAYLVGQTAFHKIAVLLPTNLETTMGQTFGFSVLMEKAMLFDPISGASRAERHFSSPEPGPRV